MTEAGLKKSYGPILMAIKMNPGCSMKDISESIHVDKALVTRTSAELMKKGLIENSNPGARQYSLHITKKGEDAFDKVDSAVSKAWGELLCDLTDDEIESGKRILNKILRTAEKGLEDSES
ncbi:MAG: MarR family transcriptional regulator [Candidatus Methanomethylophilaceae archaeon]|nr:MarR family transcriptional regulator [Candidatus Methanomethylophilaceae archaeon]